MRQIAVLIGVRQPGGGLDQLNSISKCLTEMRDWALSQQIARSDIKIFTDIPGLVEPGDPAVLSVDDIFNWIDARAKETQPADQLVVYFSGHGMQSGGATLWLLPRAPAKDWEAVNLDTSMQLAIWSRFKHVVFIGDCCASVADNAQFDMVKGASIFENTPEEKRIKQQPVDFLRAARPGKVSLEVIINGETLSPYTVQLIEALGGTPATILEPQVAGAAQPLILRVRKLADELRTSVNAYLRAHSVTPPGPPFDNVVSTTQWIALFPTLPLPPQPPIRVPPPPAQASVPPGTDPVPVGQGASIFGAAPGSPTAGTPLSAAKEQSHLSLDADLLEISAGNLTGVAGTEWSSNIPDGYHYETQCGFFITGGSVVSAEGRLGVDCQVFSNQEIKVNPITMELVSIEFEGGGGIMIPAIPGQIGFLHLENGRMGSLAYEPSGHADVTQKSGSRSEFETKSQRIRDLRDTLQNVVTGGELNFTDIDPQTILRVIEDINYGGKVDFSTLLYMSYAAFASRLGKRALPSLAHYTQSQYGFVPFDLKILLSLARQEPMIPFEFAPPFPLLTQGWSLLQATHEQLPEELTELPRHYRNTSWTQLDSAGVSLCRAYLSNQTASGTSGQSGNIPVAFEEPATATLAEEPTRWLERAVDLARRDALAQAPVDDEEQGMTMTE